MSKSDRNYKEELPRPKLVNYLIQEQVFRVPPHYQIIKVIGQGSYALVVSAFDSKTGRHVAIKKNIKIFDRDENDGFLTRRILREVKLMEHFRDLDNIITLRDLIPPVDYKHFDDVYLVMDLMEKDLRSILKSQQKFDSKTVKYFAYQLLKGIKIIHSADVVHRDIKPSNILLNRRLELCYCDFGLARELDLSKEVTMSTPYVVTRWYRAPELLAMYEHAGPAFDIWSIGCVFFELLQDYPRVAVFQGKNHLNQLDLIMDILGTPSEKDVKACKNAREYIQSLPFKPQTKLIDHPLMPSDVDRDAVDILEKMLMFNPDKRISAVDALAHPYFAEFHDIEDEVVTAKYHGGDEKIPDDKETLRKALYEDIMRWNEQINDIKGDAEVEDHITIL